MNSFSPGKKALLVFSFLIIRLASFSQNEPISQAANSMVDLLTGDFNYSLPVMTVPGPNGESVPISFSYHGGIRMDEEASWIGLGWNYNPGEITRSLKGVADDWRGVLVTSITTANTQKTDNSNYFGPLYYRLVNYETQSHVMDVTTSAYKTDDGFLYAPAYDPMHVSGPGISGTIELRMFDYSCFHTKTKTNEYYDNSNNYQHFSKLPNFVFTDELNADIKVVNGAPSGAYTASTNRAKTAYYIEKWTNSELNNTPSGFLDYRIISSGLRRPASDVDPNGKFDPDGIGAIRITSPDGMIYHYSLPVYMLEGEQTSSFDLTSNFEIDNNGELIENSKSGRYAVSWKLTAVTGPDYSDLNDNHMADIGDSGYWIAYNYGKWTDNFNWQTPFFNYNTSQYDKREPYGFRHQQFQPLQYKVKGTVNSGQIQSYYLNSIQTASHTAFFIKEIRLDAHAVPQLINNNIVVTPSLRLKKIVLVKNENISLFNNSSSLPPISGFSLVNCSPATIQPHIGNYTANALQIKAATLAMIDLTADYSLCKYSYNNIKNTFSTAPVSYSRATLLENGIFTGYTKQLYKKFDHTNPNNSFPYSSSDPSNSGKPTLKELKIYGFASAPTTPSFLFNYDENNIQKNPNYSTFKKDNWGYYKSDFSYELGGHHTTEGSIGSCNNVDAWSLKKIITPLGGEINIVYEADVYEAVNYGSGYKSPKRNFLISSANMAGVDVTVSAEIASFLDLGTLRNKLCFIPSDQNSLVKGNDYHNTTPESDMVITKLSSTIKDQKLSVTGLFGTWAGNYNANGPGGYGHIQLVFNSVSGGGTRVKEINISDPTTAETYKNEYVYESGAAGTEPVDIYTTPGGRLQTNKNMLDPMMPSPLITYGKITVRSKGMNNAYSGKTEYIFNNKYEPVKILVKPSATNPALSTSQAYQTSGLLYNLLKTNAYDNNNNLISSAEYQYEDNAVPMITEQFKTSISIPNQPNSITYENTSLISYRKARLIKKIINTDGIISTEQMVAWDPITGNVIKSITTDPTSSSRLTETALAYTTASYADMGAKSVNPAYKNMLNAPYKTMVTAGNIIQEKDGTLKEGEFYKVIAGTKTTWRQTIPKRIYDNTNKYITQIVSTPDWKPFKTFVFNGDVNDANWREESEITLFNARQQPLEIKGGVSNRYGSSKMGYNQQFELCSGKDMRYADFAFSSFEDQETVASGVVNFGGEVTLGTMRAPGTTAIKTHTGMYYAKVPANTTGPGFFTKGFTTGRSYRASVWVYKDNTASNPTLVVTLDGSNGSGSPISPPIKTISRSDASNITAGNWILMTLTVDVPANYVGSGGSYGLNDLRAYLVNSGSAPAYFDDFMFRPVDAVISGNVIDERTGRTLATLDNQNFGTKYDYDFEGRVKRIWVETPVNGFRIKTNYSYNYKRPYINN